MLSFAIGFLKKKRGRWIRTAISSRLTAVAGFLLLSLITACSPITREPTLPSPIASSTIPPPSPINTATVKKVSTPEFTATPTVTSVPIATVVSSTSILDTIPKGEYIVYFAQDNLYLLAPDASVQREFVLDIPDPGARLSPDNQFIVFSNQFTSPPWYSLSVFDIPKNTKRSIQNGEGCADPDWGPERKLVASCDGEIYLWLSPLDNGERMKLTNCQNVPIAGSCSSTTWSPNGKWIAYDNNTGSLKENGVDGLYLIDTSCLVEPASCPEKTLGPLAFFYPGQAGLYARTWSPDGRYLAIQGAEPTGDLKQEIQFFDTETGQFTSDPIALDTGDEPRISSMAWSPDGNWIAYAQYTGMFVVSLSDKQPRRLLDQPRDVAFWLTIP